MIDFPEWDDCQRGAWKAFEKAVYAKALALNPDRRLIVYTDIVKLVDEYWEHWVNGSEERRKVYGKAKKEIAFYVFKALHGSTVISIPPKPKTSWVTEFDKQSRYYWPLTQQVMAEDMGQDITFAIDRQSEIVLQHLQDPRRADKWKVRGLVVGNIQAGKTANYSALISKATDAGYRLFIVLAGVHNDLRSQTQKRLDHDFTGFSQRRNSTQELVGVGKIPDYDITRQPQAATNIDQDFGDKDTKMEELPWLVVMKKEKHRLEKLIKWLKNQPLTKPVLIIDDEADQATINTVAKIFEEDNVDENLLKTEIQEASQINSLIRQVVNFFPRCSYVGYTASPFANLFVDASAESPLLGEDLFPKDFIVKIPTPENYFGPKEYFDPDSEEEAALFMPFPLSDASAWIAKDEVGSFPPAARKCLWQFLVSASIKAWRANRRKGSIDPKHPEESSMLVHVSHLVDVQKKLAAQFSDECRTLRQSIVFEGPDSELGEALKSLFAEQLSVTKTVRAARDAVDKRKDWSLPETFEALWPWIEKIVNALEVILVNGESEPERKDLLGRATDADRGLRPLIWIGGNKLSRGLTIPSLCMSLFLRVTGAADSLLQMGRWFGYRDGYADLCRISTTLRLADRFMKISCTLDDLSEQLSAMNNLIRRPTDYRLIVQQHPGFLLTSANKMRMASEISVCYAGYYAEMRQFNLSGLAPMSNFNAAQQLIESADNLGRRVYDSDSSEMCEESQPNWVTENSQPSGCLWREVPAFCITEFFKSYCSQEGVGSANEEIRRIIRYISEENKQGRLRSWNVWLPKGRPTKDWLALKGKYYPSQRNSKGDSLDGDCFKLSVLQTGGDQFNGVRKPIIDAAKKALMQEGKTGIKGELFRQVRRFAANKEIAGENVNEGYLRLYAIKSDHLTNVDSLLTSSGSKYPLISYGVWMPGDLSVRGMINSSVVMTENENI